MLTFLTVAISFFVLDVVQYQAIMLFSLGNCNDAESLPVIIQMIMDINYNISGSNVTENALIFSIQALTCNPDKQE